MSKLKTHSGAAKRFKKRGEGYKCKSAYTRHILTKKSSKQKRQLRGLDSVKACDVASVQQMLPHTK